MNVPLLPTINASFNALAGMFLVSGFIAIRRKNVALHHKLMLCAFASSVLFLCCYTYYHATHPGITKYPGTGLLKMFYLAVLIPHSILAVVIIPFILKALWHAFRAEFNKHTAITRRLFPVWVYVSVTGVIVYLMLYVFPAH